MSSFDQLHPRGANGRFISKIRLVQAIGEEVGLTKPVDIERLPDTYQSRVSDGKTTAIYRKMEGGRHKIAMKKRPASVGLMNSLAHEMIHAKQVERMGSYENFKHAYGKSIRSAGYEESMFEKEARRGAARITQRLLLRDALARTTPAGPIKKAKAGTWEEGFTKETRGFDAKQHPRWPAGTPGIGGQFRPDGMPDSAAAIAAKALGSLDSDNPQHRELAKNFNTEAKKVDWENARLPDAAVHDLLLDNVVKPLRSKDTPDSSEKGDAIDTEARSARGENVDAPVNVGGDVTEAARLLAEGKRVELDQPREVSTLLEKLREIGKDAEAKGEKAPVYDLCKVSVKHTNLFCTESKGIPRVEMPQLKGFPIKGSKADNLARNEKGEVDLSGLFEAFLAEQGIHMESDEEQASHLRASQRELNGAKVAGITGFLQDGGDLSGESIFVSRDNYVIDGHHRWASTVAHDLEDNKLGDLTMPVKRIDAGIIQLLELSLKFAEEWGIPQAGVGAPSPDIKKGALAELIDSRI